MTSAIVRTNPTSGTATTSSVRNNFGFAADEINRLLRANTDKVESTGTNEIAAQFGNVPTFSLADGIRVLIQIATTTTSGTPTLNVNSSGNVPIKKSDNTDLAIGDLVAGGYYEFVYSSLNNYWLVLNLPSPFSSQNKLFEAMLGGLYPVGSLLTTTLATDPGTADYFFSGITFGTWEAYAAGRTIVGIDTGTTITSASSSSNVVTLVVASHSLSAGDSIVVSGFTSDTDANGTFTVDSTTSTNIVYTAANVSDGALTGTDLLVKNAAFDTAQEVGGESSVTLVTNNVPEHRHHTLTGASDNSDLSGNESMAKSRDISNSRFSYSASGNSGEPDLSRTGKTILDSSSSDITQTAVNNLQPYITTYIWKRTV
jgi:hypothetical protein